jgi:hypothetical protein
LKELKEKPVRIWGLVDLTGWVGSSAWLWASGSEAGTETGSVAAVFSGAKSSLDWLSGAGLSVAELSGAGLSVAELSGAELSGAGLSGAGLSGPADKLEVDELGGVKISVAKPSGSGISSFKTLGSSGPEALVKALLFRP